VAAAWYLPSQATASATQLFNLRPRPIWRAPQCFFYEFNNLMLKQEQRRVLVPFATEEIAADLRGRLGLTLDPAPENAAMAAAVSLARGHRISLFDGFYLLQAMTLAAPLATRDAALAVAIRAEGGEAFYVGEGA
jgi:predicted nucleic acid-binding protein